MLFRLAVQLGQRKRTLRELSRTDSLTGLFNRRYFSEQASLVFDDCRAPGQAAGLALIDVDHFKPSKERYGHLAGAAVLREVGGCISATSGWRMSVGVIAATNSACCCGPPKRAARWWCSTACAREHQAGVPPGGRAEREPEHRQRAFHTGLEDAQS